MKGISRCDREARGDCESQCLCSGSDSGKIAIEAAITGRGGGRGAVHLQYGR